MKLATYIVAQGDTLEVLAQKLLGDVTQTSALISINQLRYPYISDNPADQYTRIKGSIYLAQQYVNPQTFTMSNPNSVVINQNDTVFFMQGSAYGAAAVQSVSGNTVTLSAAVAGTFDAAAILEVYANQQNVKTQVLRTGDTLLYPANSQQSGGSNSLVFGTDWKLDDNGFLQKDGGDIATISGADNLMQALSMRYNTPYGSLNLHSDYGNSLFSILGESSQSYFRALAANYLQQCGMQDIRVQSVQVTNFSITADTVTATLTIVPIGSQDPIVQPISIPIGGL